MAKKLNRWSPRVGTTRQEDYLLKRMKRVRKLFRFLREYRHELFDDVFQDELEAMYRGTGAGKPPVPPAMMAMATLLQGYVGASDAEAVELTVVDLRWQMVLDCLGATEPAFSQGALYDFRYRLIKHEMDRRLLERTRELAIRTGAFDGRKLPTTIRAAFDSSPLVGAGRVEDTFNLLGHAARNVVACVAALLDCNIEQVCKDAGIPVLLAPSVKKGLDCDWTDPAQKARALQTLLTQMESLQEWVLVNLPNDVAQPPLQDALETLKQIIEQDIDPDPDGTSKPAIRKGVAPDRRVSIEDSEMRHGRKSKSKRFNGYKRHIAADLDSGLILACAITPANLPEEEAASRLQLDIEHQGMTIEKLYIDRGYINSTTVEAVLGIPNGDVFCKPWRSHNATGKAFTKANFRLNMRDMTITCPAGEVETMRPGKVVEFDPEACHQCTLREQCTMAAPGRGRTVSIMENEKLQQRLRKRVASPKGREQLRARTAVEHKLAHIGRRQGRRARYYGTRSNLFDLRRAATIQNLETNQRLLSSAQKMAA